MPDNNGVVNNLFLKKAHREPMQPVSELRCIEGKGIVGDVSFGRETRQILIIDNETLDALSLDPGLVRENLTVRNFPLSSLQPAALVGVGDVQLEITGECTPCSRMDDIRPGLQQVIENRRGVLARVLRSGVIHVGAPIRRLSPRHGRVE